MPEKKMADKKIDINSKECNFEKLYIYSQRMIY